MLKNKINFSEIKYLICDWDGTLVQSLENLIEVFVLIMKQNFGVSKQKCLDFFVNTNGRPLSFQFTEAARKLAGVKIEDSAPYEKTFWKLMEGKIPKPISGAKEFLEEIKKIGLNTIVWSGTRNDSLEKQIKVLGFDSLVSFWVGMESGTSARNKAVLFPEIIEFCGISKEELIEKSIIFGDGMGDIEAGKDLGIQTVGFLNNGKNNLENLGADLLVESFEDFLVELKNKNF
jgi:phosphoglycolate phosphatase-like HAD superfamily hydrolase